MERVALPILMLATAFCCATSQLTTNEIHQIDLMATKNSLNHKTQYYVAHRRSLILRRGSTMDFAIHMARNFDAELDKLRLEIGLGAFLQYLPILQNKTFDDATLDARIVQIQERRLELQLNLPANMAIGQWSLRISSKLNGTRDLNTVNVVDSLMVIFNPWCPEDQVFLASEPLRQEYVLNEVGKYYRGSYYRPQGRRWVYGQFDPSVLPSVFLMLNRMGLSVEDRVSAAKVARAVSAMANSHDDRGILVGDWSGSYLMGRSPESWSGSAPIFREFLRTDGNPVRFGQCWVFGGVTTTALRTLGIPSRMISNFVSAHDTDSTLTVDQFNRNGEKLEAITKDSIRNFHVWSEAWMTRNDLPTGFDGWQVIDGTPQQLSMGKFQLGPASVEAVKRGKVRYGYDVGFVFAEVNAPIVKWELDRRTQRFWRRTSVTTGHCGRRMLTKMVGYLDPSFTGTQDAVDIVSNYKYPIGSLEFKQAHNEAVTVSGLEPLAGLEGR